MTEPVKQETWHAGVHWTGDKYDAQGWPIWPEATHGVNDSPLVLAKTEVLRDRIIADHNAAQERDDAIGWKNAANAEAALWLGVAKDREQERDELRAEIEAMLIQENIELRQERDAYREALLGQAAWSLGHEYCWCWWSGDEPKPNEASYKHRSDCAEIRTLLDHYPAAKAEGE